MNSDQVGGLLRTLAAMVGGFAVGHGWLSANDATLYGGMIVAAGVAAWSAYTNKPGTVIPPSKALG